MSISVCLSALRSLVMLILNKQDIQQVFSMADAINACHCALQYYSSGKSTVPLRVNVEVPKQQGHSLFMPAYVPETDALGIKIVSVFPNNVLSGKSSIVAQMLLMDAQTGEVCAMMDGTYLTQLRTGALQGVATKALSRKDAKTAVLFGTGGQARAQLEAMLTVRSLDLVSVYGAHYDKTQNFVADMQREFSHFNTHFIAVNESSAAIKNADIITTVTNSKTPVFDAAKVKKGAHINAIGAYKPDMQEIPESIIQRADTIIFDTMEGVLAEAGDILIPLNKGLVNQDDFDGELGEVLLGKAKGRESAEDITFFKAVGSAVFDVVTAHQIYIQAKAKNIGKKIVI